MFKIGQVYRRQEDVHDRYGGNRQSGIAPSAKSPYIFLFNSPRGEDYGYEDGWISKGKYQFTGEGQFGNMEMARGNKAIFQHQEDGRELHLFKKIDTNRYEYVGQFEYLSHKEQGGEDADGKNRTMIIFHLNAVK